MNDQSDNSGYSVKDAPWPRWLRFGPACQYVGIRSATMTLKLAAGIGPAYRFVPGSRVKIFHTSELDRWIEETPPPPMSDAERGRLEKLQAGARRVREAWRQAKTSEKTDTGCESKLKRLETEPAN